MVMQATPVIQNPAYIPDAVVQQYSRLLASGIRPVVAIPFNGLDGQRYSVAALDAAPQARYRRYADPAVPIGQGFAPGDPRFVNAPSVGFTHAGPTTTVSHFGGFSSGGVQTPPDLLPTS